MDMVVDFPRTITLYRQKDGQHLVSFKMEHIKSYSYRGSTFMIQAGTKCNANRGWFTFQTSSDIIKHLKQREGEVLRNARRHGGLSVKSNPTTRSERQLRPPGDKVDLPLAPRNGGSLDANGSISVQFDVNGYSVADRRRFPHGASSSERSSVVSQTSDNYNWGGKVQLPSDGGQRRPSSDYLPQAYAHDQVDGSGGSGGGGLWETAVESLKRERAAALSPAPRSPSQRTLSNVEMDEAIVNLADALTAEEEAAAADLRQAFADARGQEDEEQ